ncbi:MAG TPA: hypothetical protein VKE51_17270 [Vicinamibacterales bacterium]|nr:hypothetical protein [Vicinamibacterales bacterium]
MLAALAAVNPAVWIWIAHSVSHTPYAQTQLLLSGVYVSVCGFRSLFPRVDVERACVWDTWLSAILLGRTAATVAELCFALQCTLFVHRLSDIVGMPLLAVEARLFLPLAFLAELLCWHAVLSLNHMGHAIEESLWALLMLLLSATLGAAAFAVTWPLRVMLIAGCVVYALGAGLTIAYDVTMYLHRWHAGGSRLTLATGLRDSRNRRHPIFAWEIWREEMPWMTLYFSIGVWTSLAMVLLERAASRS